ncbi:MAG: hypothetical protein ABR909_02555 [Candidatus Bathyarchaeia archaeon]|jgi:hypothetical protein
MGLRKSEGFPYCKAFIYQQSSANNGSKATEYANIPIVDSKERLDSIRVPSVTIKVYFIFREEPKTKKEDADGSENNRYEQEIF